MTPKIWTVLMVASFLCGILVDRRLEHRQLPTTEKIESKLTETKTIESDVIKPGVSTRLVVQKPDGTKIIRARRIDPVVRTETSQTIQRESVKELAPTKKWRATLLFEPDHISHLPTSLNAVGVETRVFSTPLWTGIQIGREIPFQWTLSFEF